MTMFELAHTGLTTPAVAGQVERGVRQRRGMVRVHMIGTRGQRCGPDATSVAGPRVAR